MATTATQLTISELNIPATPSLIIAPINYNAEHFNLLNNQLRLYFNRLNAFNKDLLMAVQTGETTATSYDAFGRLRVGNPYTIFDSQNRYAIDNQFDTSLTGSASITYLSNESSVSLDVTTASGDEVIRETKRVFPYQPGKSLLVLATFVMGEGETNLRQRVGYFGANDGVFLERSGDTVKFVIRTSTTGSTTDARFVNQADWNGDKLNGTGASGYTLDLQKSQILWMDFEWLGVGAVRCGFVINGEFIVAHTFYNANESFSVRVYIKTAILPIRYEITATGTLNSARTLKQICSTVVSEGGYQQKKAELSARRTTELSSISTTFLPLVSIRLNSGSLDAVIVPQAMKVIPTTSQNYEIALIKNGTLTADSWDTSTFDNVDYDVSATAITGGDIVQQEYIATSNQSGGQLADPTDYNWALQLGRTIAGTSDILTLAIRTLSGATTGDAFGSLSFYDLTNGQ